jgi:tripartite-type tricarboxylate transporter receptor subunit TctC
MRPKFLRVLTVSALVVAPLLSVHSARADETYPNRPVRLLLPFPPGGGVDANGRLLAKALSDIWKQPVVVENMAGAATTIATKAVINAKPDGYTLGMVTSRLAINPAIFKEMPYAPDDFKPVMQLLKSPMYLIANPTAPGTASLADLVKHAKSSPVKVATAGAGDITSLPVERLNKAAGIELKQVPYIGAAAMLTAAVSGEVELSSSIYPVFKSMLKDKRVKALAVLGDSRSPTLPDVPAVKEVVPGYTGIEEWYGIIAPKAIPPAVVQKLRNDVLKAMASKELKDRFIEDGNVAVGSTPEEFAVFLKTQTEMWKKTANEVGISLELK